MTEIIHERPPNFDDIAKVFPMAFDHGIIFAYGDAIYAPTTRDISLHILKHELVHCKRQADKPEEWWHNYLTDLEFRFNEELLAHIIEYKARIEDAVNRKQRRASLNIVAKRLSSPLYGRMTTMNKAKQALTYDKLMTTPST